ncbi:MAG: folylpolyglutamate synthase/dihydrofolate synthase family protein [Thermodesulfobacteriota bacterium]
MTKVAKTLSYNDALEYLYGLQKYGIKFGLSKTANLLKAFGDPQKGLRCIHIAGTNGKGSVAAMVESILMKAGLKVALYSSPHLVRFTERFRINRREISPAESAGLIHELRSLIHPDHPPTFFEVTTAMSLIYFAREKCDVAIMEVGMGGRLDATNVIRPMVSVITNISLDHQVFLGRRLLDIAREKAGIIKRGVDVVTGATQGPVLDLFRAVCANRKARLWRVGGDIRYRWDDSGLYYYGLERTLRGLRLGLRGDFQHRNAAIALGAIEVLGRKGIEVSDRDVAEGLEHPRWPGRVHVVSTDPLIVLDGGHNPGAIRALAATVRRDFRYQRLILVLGVMKDKDIRGILGAIVPMADVVLYTAPAYERAASPEDLMKEARPLRRPGKAVFPLARAIAEAKALAGPGDMILVCGSLFTVGEALTCIDPETYGADRIRW